MNLGMKKEHLRFRPHAPDELAHYAKAAEDIEYQFPFGWHEIEGIHNRGDWDLARHSKFSGQDFSETDPATGKKFYPFVIETSAGADRAALAFLIDAYEEIAGGRTTTTKSTKEIEVVLRLDKRLAPYKAAVLPLSKKESLITIAKNIHKELRRAGIVSDYDETQSIGRRYRRQDEIGTPCCITVDFDTLGEGKDASLKDTVTVRDRDTMSQERVKIAELPAFFRKQLAEE